MGRSPRLTKLEKGNPAPTFISLLPVGVQCDLCLRLPPPSLSLHDCILKPGAKINPASLKCLWQVFYWSSEKSNNTAPCCHRQSCPAGFCGLSLSPAELAFVEPGSVLCLESQGLVFNLSLSQGWRVINALDVYLSSVLIRLLKRHHTHFFLRRHTF